VSAASGTRAHRWVDDIDPVSAAVNCGDSLHIVSWRRGKLVLEDHDLSAELAAIALGAPAPECVELLYRWRDRVLWRVAAAPDPPGFVRKRAPVEMPFDLVPVRQLGVARAWARAAARRPESDDAEHLYRFLRARALAALLTATADAQARYGGGRVSFVEVRLLAADATEIEVVGRVDKLQTALVVSLAPSWLHEVWARGIGVVDGAFVARVTDAIAWPSSADVRAVVWREVGDRAGVHEPELADAQVRLTAEGYSLTLSAA
jgi:hypothetical protein